MKTDAPTLSLKDKELTRDAEARRLRKVAADRQRRVDIKVAAEMLERAGVTEPPADRLAKEQRDRAVLAAKTKQGLTGRALAEFILDGKDGAAQVAEARAAARAAARSAPPARSAPARRAAARRAAPARRAAARRAAPARRAKATRSRDEEASDLATAAKILGLSGTVPVRSNFLPKQAREFLGEFVQVAEGQSITVTRNHAQGLEGALEEVTFKRAELRRYAIDGTDDKQIRGSLKGLSKGTGLWGRKLALFILATDRAGRTRAQADRIIEENREALDRLA